MIKIKDARFLNLIRDTYLDFTNVPAHICSPEDVKAIYGNLIEALKTVKKTKRISLIEAGVIFQYVYGSINGCNSNPFVMSINQKLYLEWVYMSDWIEKHFEIDVSNDFIMIGGQK